MCIRDRNWQGWWESWAKELQWDKEWEGVLEWDPPYAQWFLGGKLNASVQCLDRHVAAGHGQRVAFHWEGEPGEKRTRSFQDMLEGVCRTANGLGMLLWQGAKALEIWTGQPAPIDLMRTALKSHVYGNE